jgi:transposase InsO family protein
MSVGEMTERITETSPVFKARTAGFFDVNWFLSLDDAKEKIEAFKDDYNGFRPHSALCGLTPNQVVEGHHQTRNFPL